MTAPDLQGLSHLGFSVHDVPAAVRFWTEVFGFRAVVEEPGFAFLSGSTSGWRSASATTAAR
jgi:catechol 2,3-dioxygenase-like lactoylglutathione lyase family enzyme